MKKTILIAIMLTAGLYASNTAKSICVSDMGYMNKNIDKYFAFKKSRYMNAALNSAIDCSYSCNGEAKEVCVKIVSKIKSMISTGGGGSW